MSDTAKELVFNLGFETYKQCTEWILEVHGVDLFAVAFNDPRRALELLMDSISATSLDRLIVGTGEGQFVRADMDGAEAALGAANHRVRTLDPDYDQTVIRVWTTREHVAEAPGDPTTYKREMRLSFVIPHLASAD